MIPKKIDYVIGVVGRISKPYFFGLPNPSITQIIAQNDNRMNLYCIQGPIIPGNRNTNQKRGSELTPLIIVKEVKRPNHPSPNNMEIIFPNRLELSSNFGYGMTMLSLKYQL